MRQKVIIDCDPGFDDAIAIAIALSNPKLDILGITTVAGNRDLEKTTANALITLEYFEYQNIPVYKGAENPLKRESYQSGKENPHGLDGLGDTNLPTSTTKARENAVRFIDEQVKKYPGEIIILAIGPLTNIALWLGSNSGALIKSLYIMNGAFWVPGNTGPHAEFNAFFDPEAAKIVYDSGLPINVSGLDVTDKVAITKKDFFKIAEIGTKKSNFLFNTHRWAIEKKIKKEYAIFWDECALLWLIDDTIVKSKKGRIAVDTSDEFRGRTIFTEGDYNIKVGTDIDAKKFFEHLFIFLKSV